MGQNKYHIRIARDETRSMSRYERLWYQGTARWFFLFGLFVLAGVSVFLVVASIRAKPQTQVAGSRIVAPVTERNFPHFYLVVNTGNVEFLPSAKNVWESAKSGVVLRDGDAIRTKADSYATLLSNTDTVVRVAPQSEVQILNIGDPSAKYATVNMRINSGSMWLTLSRVAGQKTHAMVTTPHGFFASDEGIFSVTAGSRDVVSTLSGSAKVSVLASAEKQSDDIIQNAQTHATNLTAGQQATMQPEKPSALIGVENISSATKNSYWFRWNADLDSQYQSSLLNAFDKNAPPLKVDTSAEHLVAHTAPFVVIRGTTSLDARIFVNSVEAANNAGAFSYTYSFPNGNGPQRVGLTVVAMNRFGEQTSKDIVVEFQPEVSAK